MQIIMVNDLGMNSVKVTCLHARARARVCVHKILKVHCSRSVLSQRSSLFKDEAKLSPGELNTLRDYMLFLLMFQ